MAEKRVSLYCTEGGSDKVYTLWVEPKGGLWSVEANWGRRGGAMQAGAKTPKPVSRADAEKVYEKTLSEKRAKGYHEGEDAPAFSQVKDAVDAGVRPMLLTPAEESDIDRFVADDAWGGQQKMNGKRVILKVGGGKVVGVNRRGLECPIPVAVEKAFSPRLHLVLDGELIGDVYHAFDILERGTTSGLVDDLRGLGMRARHIILSGPAWLACADDEVRVVPLVIGKREKAKLVDDLRKQNQEGVVFKKLDGTYVPGKVENLAKAAAVKVKFYAEGAFSVLCWNKGTSSIQVALRDPKNGKLVPCGNVTIAQKYAAQVKDGFTVRVRYLYATDADQLYQPNLDPDDHGSVVSDGPADKVGSLKHEGKDE